MGSRNRAVARALTLLILVGLLIWHAVYWQSTGMYVRMFDLLETGKGYLTVLYNLGFIIVTGIILGILPGVIAGILKNQNESATPASHNNSERRRPR